MLDNIVISVLNMSLIGSYVIALVLIARLLLKKAPKIFSYVLWGIVLFRLLCPFSFESAFSLIPMGKDSIPQDIIYSTAPQIDIGGGIADDTVNSILPAPNMGDSVNPIQILIFIGTVIWVLGILAMVIYSIAAFVKLRRSLIGAVHLKENIYLADHISSPFVMGMVRPKIYLPSSLSDIEKDLIIAHERCHIKRFDYVTRMLGFAALTVHWFNPLVWAAFVISGKDMEMSCDEAAMKKMDADIRAKYSGALLHFGTKKSMIHATPPAFGEGDTKNRIKNVLNYKKPAFWVIVVSVVAVAAVGIGLAANPKENSNSSLLNPNNLANAANRAKDKFTVVCEDGDYVIKPSDLALFLSDTNWKQKSSEMLKLVDTYHMEVSGCRIKLYESEPELMMISGEMGYRYYTAKDAYERFSKLLLPTKGDDIPAPSADDADPLKAAIHKAIMEQNKNDYHPEDFACESNVILATEAKSSADNADKIEEVSVYAMVLYKEYSFTANGVTDAGGSNIPTAITFYVNSDGSYSLKEYWIPRDAPYYALDIKAKFPANTVEDALDTLKFAAKQQQSCDEQAIAAAGIKTDKVADAEYA
ncbi:MAG: M56 family metallopeptidase, partial [Oscillospiraceae bacterium]